MPNILITPRSITAEGHPALERLRNAGFELRFCTPGRMPDEEELLALLPGCAGYLAGVERVTARVLDAADELKVISRNGIGVDGIDLAAAETRGIRLCRVEGAHARSVAELTIGLLFSLARSIPFSDRQLKSGAWQRRRGVELAGQMLGLIGCGHVGRLVAEMAVALGMEVVACTVTPREDSSTLPGLRYAPLAEVLRTADFLSLHCPAASDGRPILGNVELAAMKFGAFLINTARASLVDSQALRNMLEGGHLAGAAIDVYDSEPPGSNPLVAFDRVVATPHIGTFTSQSVDRLMYEAVANLLKYLPGHKLANSLRRKE